MCLLIHCVHNKRINLFGIWREWSYRTCLFGWNEYVMIITYSFDLIEVILLIHVEGLSIATFIIEYQFKLSWRCFFQRDPFLTGKVCPVSRVLFLQYECAFSLFWNFIVLALHVILTYDIDKILIINHLCCVLYYHP